MPEISNFYGIKIRIFFKDHNPPHFHAYYGEFQALIEIYTGRVIAGSIPRRARLLVEEWRIIHLEELSNCWEDISKKGTYSKIPGLE